MSFILSLMARIGLGPLGSKLAVYAVLAAAIALSYLLVYQLGVSNEHARNATKIAEYNGRLEAAKIKADAKIAALVESVLDLQREQDALLDAVESNKARVITIVKEVPKYVTKEADAGCIVTHGFVSLYNLSLSTDVAGVSGSEPKDVDRASGVALSEVARVSAANNAECVARGAVIGEWQRWYGLVRVWWEKLRKEMPELPPLPT